jgi:hypothetical protein
MLQVFRGSVFRVQARNAGALQTAAARIAPRRVQEQLEYWTFMLGQNPSLEASPNRLSLLNSEPLNTEHSQYHPTAIRHGTCLTHVLKEMRRKAASPVRKEGGQQ